MSDIAANAALAQPLIGSRRETKGRPLFMLGLLTGTWVIARMALWEPPFPQAPRALGTMSSQIFAAAPDGSPKLAEKTASDAVMQRKASDAFTLKPRHDGTPLLPVWGSAPQHSTAVIQHALPSDAQFLTPASDGELPGTDFQTAASHQLMWMAAMAYAPVPKAIRSALAQSEPAQPLQGSRGGILQPPAYAVSGKADANRWSLDAWAFWRQGSAPPLVAQGQAPNSAASYGGSQAGAVLRYDLRPSSIHRPRAYLRGYSSLQGATEQEVAAGVSARPLPNLPLRLHAEARALHSAGRSTARAGAFVTTELPTAKLPAGFTAEAYGQAGYVSGKNSTAFADGQAHVLREVAAFDLAKVQLGGAAFAGAQKGANRVDVGPTMRIDLTLGEAPARLSVDYRAKVAGDAEPQSGVAITLSTRF